MSQNNTYPDQQPSTEYSINIFNFSFVAAGCRTEGVPCGSEEQAVLLHRQLSLNPEKIVDRTLKLAEC